LEPSPSLREALSDRYRIEREIGAGGMATVYLAEDLRHRRRVAVKVLRPELGAVLGADRFLSEINVTANLQHPHLLPLFDSGETGGLLYYVMPYVEGESLRARLDRERQLPVDEALRIAMAIAGALDYAHRHGIIHRDLKPENILLHDGQPLVADFGIALAVSNAGGARVTQTGLSLGTPQYMSPEQATGDRVIDARSDIYSLAAVLYEMLAGDPPHIAGTTQAIIAKVLTERPPSVRAYRDSVPEHVDAAIQRGLAKLPADRFPSAGEFAEVLVGARVVGPPSAHPAPLAQPGDGITLRIPERLTRRLRESLPWAAAASGLVFAGAVALTPREPAAGGWPTVFPVNLSEGVELLTPVGVTVAISRDGSQVAFHGAGDGTRGVFVRRLDGVESRFVRGTEDVESSLAFSPDGEWLVFHASESLRKVRVGGGTPLTLTAGRSGPMHWGDGDQIIFGFGERLWRVAGSGGDAIPVATVDSARDHQRYAWPHLLPGGQAALVTIWKGGVTLDSAQLGVIRLRDGHVTELGVAGTNPRYLGDGYVVFGRAGAGGEGTLFAAPFSVRRLRVTGPAVPILEEVLVKSGGAVEMDVSASGTLIYKSAGSGGYSRLVRLDRDGAASQVGVDAGRIAFPRVSRDGRRVAFTIASPQLDIWVKDLVNGALTRVTTEGGSRPEWTPDGRAIAYIREGAVHAQPWDGSGTPEVLVPPADVWEASFGPAGSLLAVRTAGGSRRDILVSPIDSPQALRPFLATPAAEFQPRLSPDGRLLAYVADETGNPEVYVRPVPGPGGRIRVSLAGGQEPVWAPGGSTLFYRSPTHIIAADITWEPELDVVRRDTLFEDGYRRHFGRANYDVFPDGRAFVFVEDVGASDGATTGIANWTGDLRRRMEAARRPR
jgi:eukaryotic-like serine/threonine-protein kinase